MSSDEILMEYDLCDRKIAETHRESGMILLPVSTISGHVTITR
jgi:hypothetical protein